MELVTTWFGVFILDDGQIIEKKLFPAEPEGLSERLLAIDNSKILEEEKQLASGKEGILVFDQRLSDIGDYVPGEAPPIMMDEHGFSPAVLAKAMQIVSRQKLASAITPDMHLIQVVEAIDDLDETRNLLIERLRDWYRLHFPELDTLVNDDRYLELLAEHGDRESILASGKIDSLESSGGEIGADDKEALQALAGSIRELSSLRENYVRIVEAKMQEIAPNLKAVAGPLIGARLIASAKGLARLSRMPASTVQMLGAEKALFRHLTEGAKPPKHGIILQHPLLHRAPKKARGKIARTMASKLAIAARIDWNKGEFMGDELRAAIEKRASQIKRAGPGKR